MRQRLLTTVTCYIWRLHCIFQTPINLVKSYPRRHCGCVQPAHTNTYKINPFFFLQNVVFFYSSHAVRYIHLYDIFVVDFFFLQYYLNVCRPLMPQYGLSCNANSAACRAIMNGTKNPEQEQVCEMYLISLWIVKTFYLATSGQYMHVQVL